MQVERYKPEYFDQLAGLMKEHGSIARRELKDYSYENLSESLKHPNAITFCCFEEEKMTSFMVSSLLKEHPTWFVRIVCAKKTSLFNPVKVGICALYDSTIEYWESRGLTNFLYIQPEIFMSSGNSMTRKGSPKLQEYVPHNYYTVKAGEECKYGFLKNLLGNVVFEENMIARWCFKS